MAWKTSHSTRNKGYPNPKHPFLSNREQMHFQSKTKESVNCPNNDNCQYLYNCIHFQALSPLKRKEHAMKQKFCFKCFRHHHAAQCNSKVSVAQKAAAIHNTLLHHSFMNKKNSNVKPVQFVGLGQVAFVAVQLVNGNKSVKTKAYLDNGSCQSLLLKLSVREVGLKLEKQVKCL